MMFLTCPQWHSLRVLVALAVVPAFAQVYHAPPPPQHHVEAPQSNTVFVDNFTMWTGNSQLLSSLASEFSSAFVPSQLNFSSSGLQMTGPTQDFQLAGLQSLSTFTAPCTVVANVTATQGTGDPFQIFLVSADLTQYLTVTGNVKPIYLGIWVNAPNIGALGTSLGEEFSPSISPAFSTPYQIIISVAAQGAATVKLEGQRHSIGPPFQPTTRHRSVLPGAGAADRAGPNKDHKWQTGPPSE